MLEHKITKGTSSKMATFKGVPKSIRLSFYGILLIVGGFSAYVLSAWSVDHLFNNRPVDETGWIIFGASILRLITLGVALMALLSYFHPDPKKTWLIAFALCACGSAQLIYPLAEIVVKLLVLFGIWEATGKGISNMGGEGWFNHGAAWLIFGIPGILFFVIAKNYWQDFRVRRVYTICGSIMGILLLLLIGAING